MNASSIDLEALLRRLHLPTVRRLYRDLEVEAEKSDMSFRDYLAVLISEEVAHRAQTRITRSTRKARFPFLATVENFDFTFQTSIRLSALGSLLGPELVSEGRCAIFQGPSGTGKTHLAIAIAYRAIQNGFVARFVDADSLLEQLSRASQRDQLQFAVAELSTHENQRVTKALNDGLQAALTGAKTPEQAMRDAQREAERILKPYR